jgi:hypothetical protein
MASAVLEMTPAQKGGLGTVWAGHTASMSSAPKLDQNIKDLQRMSARDCPGRPFSGPGRPKMPPAGAPQPERLPRVAARIRTVNIYTDLAG